MDTQPSHCGGHAYFAPVDPTWLAQSIAILQGYKSCSPGATTTCRPPGAACFVGAPGGAPYGVCQHGTATCDDTGHGGACTGYVGPSVEACGDGLDNDCDANADEGCPGTGVGELTCSQSCPAGTKLDPVTCLCTSSCGDGVCASNETRSSCPWDCAVCGDSWCQGWEPSECFSDGPTYGCICGYDCPVETPGCPDSSCNNGICEVVLGQNQESCPTDCDVDFDVCICGWDCPPATPGCPDAGGGGGGGDAPVGCSDEAFWWWVDFVGFDDAYAMFEPNCWLAH